MIMEATLPQKGTSNKEIHHGTLYYFHPGRWAVQAGALRQWRHLQIEHLAAAGRRLYRGDRKQPVECIHLIVNEEGLLHQLPDNPRASSLYILGDRSAIVGNAALMAGHGEDLIGFPKLVCRTICDEWELEMENGAWND